MAREQLDQTRVLMLPYHLINSEIKKYQNEPKFNSFYSKNNLPEKKDGAYVIELIGYNLIGAHWVALYVNGDNMTYFDSFGVEYIPREIKEFTENKHITRNIYRIQAYNSTMCGYFCMGFIYFILTRKILLDYTN